MMYCLFLQYVLKPFHDLNEKLQSEGPQIHTLQKTLNNFLNDQFSRFVKPAARFQKSVTDVNFEQHQKGDVELIVWHETKLFIAGKMDGEKMNSEKLKEFYVCVRNFYVKSSRYILKKLPLKNELLAKAEVADFDTAWNPAGRQLLISWTGIPAFYAKVSNIKT